MIDITHKSPTLRKAIASATVYLSRKETMEALLENKVPKGDVFAAARVAALFGVKKTADLIPDCHPLPIEFTEVRFRNSGLEIVVEVEVHTVYKTGVEVEAMHGASVAALTIYDMLKPIDKGIEIAKITLVEKKGGKSDFKDRVKPDLKVMVVVCSDTISAGKKIDSAGKSIQEILRKCGVETTGYRVIPDDPEQIKSSLLEQEQEGTDLLIYTGGTGLSPRDISPETVAPLLDREIPGVMEAARMYGQQRTPFAMLSRGVAGMRGRMLVLTLPGSTRGATESMEALFPYLLHVFYVAEGARHDEVTGLAK